MTRTHPVGRHSTSTSVISANLTCDCLATMTCWQVKDLETELESEQKKGQEYQKIVRKYERRIKELSYQVNSRLLVS